MLVALSLDGAFAGGGPGNALQFSDSSGNVSVAHSNALNAYPFTVTAWFRFFPFSPPGNVDLVKKHDGAASGWRLRIVNDNLSALYSVNGSTNVGSVGGFSAGFVSDGAWHHAALAVDASGGRLYLDGALAGSQSWNGTAGAPTNTQSLLLGGNVGPPTSFDLTLDEVTVWNVALSQSQIQTNKNRSLTGNEAGLIAYYRCDEGSGSTIADSAPTGGANNGSLNGPFFTSSGILPFTPSVETLAAGSLGVTNATLNGVANPEGTNTSAWFEWGTTTNYGNSTPAQLLGGGAGNTNFSQLITGLGGGVSHQFRAVASNYWGVAKGTNQSFTTPIFTPLSLSLTPVFGGSAAWGDYDNDGRLDFAISGNSSTGLVAQLWHNTGGGFSNANVDFEIAATLHGPGRMTWGDYDNDGWLDLMTDSASQSDAPAILHNTSGALQLWLSLQSFGGPAAFGDFDNDGRLDVGLADASIIHNPSTAFFRNTPGYPWIFKPEYSAYSYSPGGDETEFAWGDFNNDGRLDYALVGAGNGYAALNIGPDNDFFNPFSFIYGFWSGMLRGRVATGDFNNDGRLDIVISGQSTESPAQYITEVWLNSGAGFTNLNAGLPALANPALAVGDYDNDGRQDILLSGFATNVSSRVTQIWRNTGSGFTNINAGLLGLANGSVAWGDYDGDGRLDVLLTGSTNGSASGAVAQIWRNTIATANTPPSAPTGLTYSILSNLVVFSWNAASDAQTPTASLTYNLRVGTTPGGGDIVNPMSASSGWRRLPQNGNAGYRLSRTIAVPLGRPIYWSVQAIDNGFAGGAFAPEQSFGINLTPPGGIGAPGDVNGDGIVDQNELNLVLSNYFPYSPWLYMTNVAGLGGTNVTFALSNSTAGAFSVEYTTNLADWHFLGLATPRYLFTDTNAPAVPQRFYRLRWP
ncbi:MAG TPA: FG-GAP-like repeat-containing protein [Candidatus Acidoferrum sp.]|nr:FG-GAP-like repeat-containing protein [Candidatus Acidoferrum sp.]